MISGVVRPGVRRVVPIDFLSPGQLATYGRYVGAPSVAQLERFFHFDERDRALIARRRGDHNRLGSAVQLGTVRFLGTFLARPTEVPEIVAGRVAEELAVGDPGRLAEYARRDPTHREHAGRFSASTGTATTRTPPRTPIWLGGLTRGRGRPRSARVCCSISQPLASSRGRCCCPARACSPGRSPRRDRAAARLYRSLSEPAAAYRGPRFDGLLGRSRGRAALALGGASRGPAQVDRE